MSDVAQRSYHFGQAFLNEFIEFGTSSLAGLPCSAIFVTILFMLDTTLRSATAKLYFVCGYFIELLLFYSFSVICFPNERSTTSTTPSRNQRSNDYDDGLDEGFDNDQLYGGGDDRENKLLGRVRFLARPFQSYTSASFFNFSAGYILGYWGNLNILNGTRNAVIVVCYYVAFVLFAFLMSVFYFQHGEHGGTCSWQSGVLSAITGVIGGMVCAQLIAHRVKLETQYDNQFVLDDVNGANNSSNDPTITPRLPAGVTQCDNNSNDMVCQVFRAA